MWKCKSCSEQIENNFDSCWNCGYSRDGSPPKESEEISSEAVLPNGELLSRIAASNPTSRSRTDIAQALSRRYADAYIAARWLIRIGSIIKWVAVASAILIFVIGMAAAEGLVGDLGVFLGIILACAVGIPTFTLGILISGQGQTNLATLDTAVNTSRHLSKDDVATLLFG